MNHPLSNSPDIHLTFRRPPTSRAPPLLPHIKDKIIQHPRPRAVLAPPTHLLILQALHRKHARLIPHVLAHALLPPRLEVVEPIRQPGRDRRVPRQGRRREEETPVLERRVEGDDLLARQAGDEEGLLVDAFEKVGRRREGAAEGRYLALLFGKGFGAAQLDGAKG